MGEVGGAGTDGLSITFSTCEFRRAAGSNLLLLASRHALGNAAAASVRLPASPAPVCKTPGECLLIRSRCHFEQWMVGIGHSQ